MVLARTEEPCAARPRFRVGEYDDDSPQPLALARAGGADDLRPAAAVSLGEDDRNRRVVFNEIVSAMRSERSDLVRCVQLAKAKLAYEEMHPETRQGAAPGAAGGGKQARAKDPDAGSFVSRARDGTGWGRTTIYRWVAIGAGICASAYELALGTHLANKIGLLEHLAQLSPEQQVDVARDYHLNLARQARQKLQRYVADQAKDAAPGTDAGVDPVGEGESASGPTAPPSQADPLEAPPVPTDELPPREAAGAASILAALGVTTEAEALSCIARMREENEALRTLAARLGQQITTLEEERDTLVDGSAIVAVLRELGVPTAHTALKAVKELKSRAAA